MLPIKIQNYLLFECQPISLKNDDVVIRKIAFSKYTNPMSTVPKINWLSDAKITKKPLSCTEKSKRKKIVAFI